MREEKQVFLLKDNSNILVVIEKEEKHGSGYFLDMKFILGTLKVVILNLSYIKLTECLLILLMKFIVSLMIDGII